MTDMETQTLCTLADNHSWKYKRVDLSTRYAYVKICVHCGMVARYA